MIDEDEVKHPSDASLSAFKNPLDTDCFKLPISYLEESSIHKLSPTVASDLELAPTMYSTLFQPKTEYVPGDFFNVPNFSRLIVAYNNNKNITNVYL